MTLDEAVDDVLGFLTGLELSYEPELDRYRAITRALNKALRLNSLEKEWSWYADIENLGPVQAGEREFLIRSSVRPRIIGDDAVRLQDENGRPVRWAYFLPRDALHKYDDRLGLRAAVVRDHLLLSRPIWESEAGLELVLPVMREPKMFRLPDQPEDPNEPLTAVPDEIRNQLVDFWYPDVITLRAAYVYAQSDPVMQPRVQTIEAQYKDLMYQVIEREERTTDSTEMNPIRVPVMGGLTSRGGFHRHPHADGI
jgi:hypothetical protein